jgi:serine/threonine-protein kinase
MSPERWQQITQVFQAALACPTDERAAYLADVCADDPALRREVETMLAAHDEADSFIEAPALQDAAVLFAGAESLALGRMLDHYRIVAPLGAGGMGEVYLAEDMRLTRRVALKLLPASFSQEPERLHRFEQEAQAASALNHPNILMIYETGRHEAIYYIATEYIASETLRQRMTTTRLTLTEALDIAIQIASALTAAHEAKIAHRDIKPENVMLRTDGIVKVLDFGLAKPTAPSRAQVDTEARTRARVKTDPGMVMGTANYMSPEQARGQAVDGRTDIWSLGVVLHEMLAGHVPFTSETPTDTLAAILKTDAPPLSTVAPDAPAELERIVAKALRKDREERYQTAKDLLIDLKDVKQELEFQHKLGRAVAPRRAGGVTETDGATNAVASRTTSSAEYIATEIKKHKRAVFAALSLVALAALGLGYWFYAWHAPDSSRIESIAVLPFQNESGNADVEYLSDGMTESLINSLSQLPGMKVIARSSVFRYKGREEDVQQAARDLNVRAVLTGRVSCNAATRST